MLHKSIERHPLSSPAFLERPCSEKSRLPKVQFRLHFTNFTTEIFLIVFVSIIRQKRIKSFNRFCYGFETHKVFAYYLFENRSTLSLFWFCSGWGSIMNRSYWLSEVMPWEMLRSLNMITVVSSANCVNLASRGLGSMIPLQSGSWRSFRARISTASTNKKWLDGHPYRTPQETLN